MGSIFSCGGSKGTINYSDCRIAMAYFMASGIRFNDCLFSEPVRLADSPLPRCAGLYVILAEDRAWAPKPFQPVYFGEFGNNAPPGGLAREAALLTGAFPGKTLY